MPWVNCDLNRFFVFVGLWCHDQMVAFWTGYLMTPFGCVRCFSYVSTRSTRLCLVTFRGSIGNIQIYHK